MITFKKTYSLIVIFIPFLLLSVLFSCDANTSSKTFDSDFNYLPSSTTNSIVKHQYYTLSYSENHEQAEWVAYQLTDEQIVYTKFKRPYFEQDPKVKTGSADWRNFKKSGYTKRHLLPAADRKFSKEAYDETFLTSNISGL